jgi:hypothetical protein
MIGAAFVCVVGVLGASRSFYSMSGGSRISRVVV